MERGGLMASPLLGLIPAAAGLLAVVIGDLPFSLLGGNIPPPLLSLMPVYFWSMVRPDLMPPALAFVIGFLEDLLSGGAPGYWGLSYVVTYSLIDVQRDVFAGLSGIGAVAGFATAALVTCIAYYVIACVMNAALLPAGTLLSQVVISVIYYPLVALLMNFVHRRFVGAQRSDV